MLSDVAGGGDVEKVFEKMYCMQMMKPHNNERNSELGIRIYKQVWARLRVLISKPPPHGRTP